MAEKNHPSHTMLYKRREDGVKNDRAWNLPLETKVVDDSEIEAHQAEGWLTAAELHAAPEDNAKPRGRRGKPTE